MSNRDMDVLAELSADFLSGSINLSSYKLRLLGALSQITDPLIYKWIAEWMELDGVIALNPPKAVNDNGEEK